jgi:hypothetical protein
MALTDGMTEFWTLNDTLVGYNGNTLVSPDGLTHYVSGAIGNGWDVANAVNRVLKQTPGPFNPGATAWTLSMWVYVTDETSPTIGNLFTLKDVCIYLISGSSRTRPTSVSGTMKSSTTTESSSTITSAPPTSTTYLTK